MTRAVEDAEALRRLAAYEPMFSAPGAFKRGTLLAIVRRAGALARSGTDTPS
jgi:hypothetical protein